MKQRIALVTLLVLALTVLADDYVDDTYRWGARHTLPEPTAETTYSEADAAALSGGVSTAPATTTQAPSTYKVISETETSVTVRKSTSKVEFLNDSLTRQNPDTIVRAVIRR